MTGALATTTPYPWPFHGDLAARRTALVVAGADTRWRSLTDPTGDLAGRLAAFASALGALGVPTVVVHHGADPDPSDTPANPGAWQVSAHGLDGFFGSDLDVRLRAAERTDLLLCGFGLEGPVHSTLRSANDRGYECLTLRDLSAPFDVSCFDAALSSIEMSGGIFGAVGRSGDVIAALSAPPTTPGR